MLISEYIRVAHCVLCDPRRTHDSSASSVRMWSINDNRVLKHVCNATAAARSLQRRRTHNKQNEQKTLRRQRTEHTIAKCESALRSFADYHRSCDAVLF